MLRGSWTEESAQKAVSSWLRLSTSKDDSIDIVGAQDDSMAIGARKAFQEDKSPRGKSRWEHLLFTAATACPKPAKPGTQQDLESYRRRSRQHWPCHGNAGEGQGQRSEFLPKLLSLRSVRTRPSRRWRVLGKSKHRHAGNRRAA